MYTVSGEVVLKIQTDRGIDLQQQKLGPIFGSLGGQYDLEEIDCLILSSEYQLLSDEPELKRTNETRKMRYRIYDMKHAAVLPPIKSCWDVQKGESVIDIFPDEFSSRYEIINGRFVSTDRPDTLLFGPYKAIPAGEYDIEFRYHYEGDLPEGTELGLADVYEEGGADLSAYVERFYAGQESVRLENVQIPAGCTRLETRMYTEAAGVVADQIVIVRKEEPAD